MAQHQKITEGIEDAFYSAHEAVDGVVSAICPPLGVVDAAVHGIARGGVNWLTGTRPERQNRTSIQPVKAAPLGQNGDGNGGYGGGSRQKSTKVGNIKAFNSTPIEVGNFDGLGTDGETEVKDITGFDNSGIKVGNFRRNNN